MYFTNVDNQENYTKILVDDKVFYKLKDSSVETPTKKRRYSDILKDPVYIQKDISRKLKMIKNFRTKYGDLPELITKWKDVINDCILILKKDYEIKPSEVFEAFDLKKYNFNIEDYE